MPRVENPEGSFEIKITNEIAQNTGARTVNELKDLEDINTCISASIDDPEDREKVLELVAQIKIKIGELLTNGGIVILSKANKPSVIPFNELGRCTAKDSPLLGLGYCTYPPGAFENYGIISRKIISDYNLKGQSIQYINPEELVNEIELDSKGDIFFTTEFRRLRGGRDKALKEMLLAYITSSMPLPDLGYRGKNIYHAVVRAVLIDYVKTKKGETPEM